MLTGKHGPVMQPDVVHAGGPDACLVGIESILGGVFAARLPTSGRSA
jgi:hypothetical protein